MSEYNEIKKEFNGLKKNPYTTPEKMKALIKRNAKHRERLFRELERRANS